jgi:preprotein translocase subunit SecD
MKIGFRLWILIIAVLLSLLAIKPSFETGVVVKSVDANSDAFESGLRVNEKIISINGQEINNKEDYARVLSIAIPTDGEFKRIDLTGEQQSYVIFTNETPKITVDDVSNSKIKFGLDLRGGARALVEPDTEISSAELEDLIQVSRNRFNVYGLSDVNIRGVNDLSGQNFMLVEVAGATPNDLESLIAQQGKFEAKIANQTVFTGGEGDITDVCRNDATCAGIHTCQPTQGGYFCTFAFTIYLTQEAAERHADITRNIPLDPTSTGYLSEDLYLYVDDVEVDSLRVSSNLRGQITTQISIQGSGSGVTRQDAFEDAQNSMNNLQTILITGSLPYKLEIVKLDTISPNLGSEFIRNIIIAGISAILLVSVIVFIRYRKFKASLALLLTSFSELVIILGVAALIGWNLDLASIAGILATIGTGVDQQIVILDESSRSRSEGIRQRLKKALFVIVTAYFTMAVSMLPLYWAGAGLFKGFAFTTLIGITAGVLLTRPAFAEIIKRIEK